VKRFKLDKINVNILRALLRDARTTFTEMAKENGITAAAVRSRYENLKKSGVITGATIQINPRRLGFTCYGFLGLKVQPEMATEVKKYLSEQPYILITWDKIQEVNIGNFFAMPTLEFFTEINDNLRRHPYVKKVLPLIYVGPLANEFPENLRINPDIEINGQKESAKDSAFDLGEQDVIINTEKRFFQTPQLQQLNPVELGVAKLLTRDARTPFSTIAEKLGISTSHAIKTFKRLRERGIFLKSSITVDLKKLGYQANAMVYVKTSLGTKTVDVLNELLKFPNVITLTAILGEWDILGVIPLASFDELFWLEKNMRKIKGVANVQINTNPPFRMWPFNPYALLL